MIALTACSSGSGAPSGDAGGDASGELTTIRVGILPYANVAPLYVGMQEGIFEEHGFEIEPKTFNNGAEEVTALVADEIDVAFVGYFTAAVPISKGLPLQIISNNDQEAAEADAAWAAVTLVSADSDIQSVEDLPGKTLAVNALRSQAEVQNTMSFEAQGIDPASVNLLEVPMPEMGAALANGSVDAINIAEPFASAEIAKGARQIDAPLVSITEEGENFPNGGWAVTQDFLARSDAEALAEALAEATDFTQENPEAARAVIPEFTALTAEQVDSVRLPYWSSTVSRALVQQAIDMADQVGLLEDEVTVDDLLAEPARKFSDQ
ncbi:ABC transporter substrate-binding protein [Microbacterium album]|uniref:ABC transporter substrate-binding protein n=1 Tax=Microbacterium album TaxID=2053191 RepID=UPI001665540E|nr:ABC transporter substrate-binding protein [Microbacterium album]